MTTATEAPARLSFSKVPAVTLIFWVIKILCTTLGETGGDAVTMSMNLGYLVGTLIFAAIVLIAVTAQIRAKQFHPFLYWITIIATTTVGTTLADFADRSLGIGYAGGSLLVARTAPRFAWALVSNHGLRLGKHRQFAKDGSFLLDDHHVFADPRNGTRRLDGR